MEWFAVRFLSVCGWVYMALSVLLALVTWLGALVGAMVLPGDLGPRASALTAFLVLGQGVVVGMLLLVIASIGKSLLIMRGERD